MKRSAHRSSHLDSLGHDPESSASVGFDGSLKQCHCQTRPPAAIKIAPFSGTDDHIRADDWIDLYDSIATDHRYSDTNKIVRLGGHLRRYALAWYVDVAKRHDDILGTDWPAFKDMFKRYFSYHSPKDLYSDLSSTLSSVDG